MRISSKLKNYSVSFVQNVLNNRDLVFRGFNYDNAFYFVDKNVYKLYKDSIDLFIKDAKFILVPATEYQKSYLRLAKYYRFLVENKFTRNDVLITFGGGVLQDLSGFIASTLYRGIKWFFFPTTLLSQADSCIGSKTSINFDKSKNLIGSFYPPDKIFIDTNFCKTLPKRHFNSGIGEIIKFHLMSDEKGYVLLKQYLHQKNLRDNKYFIKVIKSTLNIKYSYFKDDEFDSSKRNLLNYGHCFGHALESASNYTVTHGEAVVIGMGFANLLALKRGIMKKKIFDEFNDVLKPYYPKFYWNSIGVEDIIFYLQRDKKRVGKDLTMILCSDIGKLYKFDDIKESEIQTAYNDFVSNYVYKKR